jgi:hypothetical protein
MGDHAVSRAWALRGGPGGAHNIGMTQTAAPAHSWPASLVTLLLRDARARCMWEDDLVSTYRDLGYDLDDAWSLVAFDWAVLAGVSYDEL